MSMEIVDIQGCFGNQLELLNKWTNYIEWGIKTWKITILRIFDPRPPPPWGGQVKISQKIRFFCNFNFYSPNGRPRILFLLFHISPISEGYPRKILVFNYRWPKKRTSTFFIRKLKKYHFFGKWVLEYTPRYLIAWPILFFPPRQLSASVEKLKEKVIAYLRWSPEFFL